MHGNISSPFGTESSFRNVKISDGTFLALSQFYL